MSLNYRAFGPLTLEEDHSKTFKQALQALWKQCELQDEQLCSAIGVYVWSVKGKGSSIPWNVGRTDSQGFESRFKQKEVDLRHLRDKEKAGTLQVHLLALVTPSGRFRKPVPKGKRLPINNWLETLLIGAALSVNPHLINRSKSQHLRTTKVDGFLNDDSITRSTAANSLSAMMTKKK